MTFLTQTGKENRGEDRAQAVPLPPLLHDPDHVQYRRGSSSPNSDSRARRGCTLGDRCRRPPERRRTPQTQCVPQPPGTCATSIMISRQPGASSGAKKCTSYSCWGSCMRAPMLVMGQASEVFLCGDPVEKISDEVSRRGGRSVVKSHDDRLPELDVL
jgi:hypothetical protein